MSSSRALLAGERETYLACMMAEREYVRSRSAFTVVQYVSAVRSQKQQLQLISLAQEESCVLRENRGQLEGGGGDIEPKMLGKK